LPRIILEFSNTIIGVISSGERGRKLIMRIQTALRLAPRKVAAARI
jgi:hypothetical protein